MGHDQILDHDQIKELCTQCQSAWVKLLTFLAFFAIVVMSTTDADFLTVVKQTEIPLLGISVATERFFYLAAIVSTLLHAYLHYYCLKLWRQAREAPDEDLAGVKSTFIGDLVLCLHPRTRTSGGDGGFSCAVTGALLWFLQPSLLIFALWRSPAAGGSTWPMLGSSALGWLLNTVPGMLLFCLCLSVAIGVVSMLCALAIRWPAIYRPRALYLLGSLAYAAFLVPALLLHDGLRPVAVDRLNLVGLGPDWRTARDSREEFRITWCGREKLPREICANMPRPTVAQSRVLTARRRAYCLANWGTRNAELCQRRFEVSDSEFLAEWQAVRNARIDAMAELDLNNRDLANASAQGTRFVNARLEGADFRKAKLAGADFEDADLKHANFAGASVYYATFDRSNLTEADLAAADLASARFEGTALVGADLRAARLIDADFSAANLTGADLRGADLSNARFYRADLTGAQLDGAIIKGSNFAGSTGLDPSRLRDVLADKDARLPPGLSVTWNPCWTGLPPLLETTLAALADQDRSAEIRAAYLGAHSCAPEDAWQQASGAPPGLPTP